jgi:hypothetical protein
MTMTRETGMRELDSIAHDAMLQHGLLPDFTPAITAEVEGIMGAATASCVACSGHR